MAAVVENGHLQAPLVSSSHSSNNFKKSDTGTARIWSARALAFLVWAAFLFWIAVLVVFPTIRMGGSSSSGSSKPVRRTGLLALLVFAAPVLLVAVLSTIYLEIKQSSCSSSRKKKAKTSLWTFPVVVEGPLGVVSAAELLLIAGFIGYCVWFMGNYIIRDASIVKRFLEIPSTSMRFVVWQLWTFVVGLRLGFLGLVCMSFLFLPVARGSPLLRLVDIPFEHAVKYHVWLGHFTMALFTIHGLCFSVVWATQGRLIEELLAWPKVGVANLPGVIALVAGVAIWLTSLGLIRKGFFELFFYTHQLYLVFVVFMAFHIGDFAFGVCMAGIFLYMIDRFLRFCQSRRSVEVLSSRLLPCGAIELVLPKPPSIGYSSLSFLFLSVPSISCLQWHPFSVSSSPYDARDTMSFLIKPLGSWTGELQKLVAQTRKGDGCCPLLLGVEGPYGHESHYYLKYEILVMVAGGIGVSPFVAVLRDILHRYEMEEENLPRQVTLVWAVKSYKELAMVNLVQPQSICPGYASRFKLVIHAYVTRETMSQADAEAGSLVQVELPCISRERMMISGGPGKVSTLVGSYSNGLMAAYLIVSIAGFFLVQGIAQKLWLDPALERPEEVSISDGTSWALKAAVLLVSMVCGVFVFGGCVLLWWNWFHQGRDHPQPPVDEEGVEKKGGECEISEESLVGPWNIVYGQRPDLKDLFSGFAKEWRGDFNVGVLVCGPETLQTSVAAECRANNVSSTAATAFHYHSVSFDL